LGSPEIAAKGKVRDNRPHEKNEGGPSRTYHVKKHDTKDEICV